MTLLREKISPQEQKNILLAMEKHTKEWQEEIFALLYAEYGKKATMDNLRTVNNNRGNKGIHLIDPRLDPSQSHEMFPPLERISHNHAEYYDHFKYKAPQDKKYLFEHNILDLYHSPLHPLLGLNHHGFDEIALKAAEFTLYGEGASSFLRNKIIGNALNKKSCKLIKYLNWLHCDKRYQNTVNTNIVRNSYSILENPAFDKFAISREKFLKTVTSSVVLDRKIKETTGKRSINLPVEQFLNLPIIKIQLTEKDQSIIEDIVSGKYLPPSLGKEYEAARKYANKLQSERDNAPKRYKR